MIHINKYREQESIVRHGISGLLLIPLLAWLLFSFMQIIHDPMNYLPTFFYSPVNVILGILIATIGAYHLNFEVKYLLKYSIENDNRRYILMLLFDFISIVTSISIILAILQLHFTGIIIA